MTTNDKFITARPSHNNSSNNQSYDVGTSLHLRASSQRQENLQAYAFHLTKCDNLTVDLDPNAETASIKNFTDKDGRVLITIPTFEHGGIDVTNPFPDLSDEEFFASLEYAEILHETGHYNHTDDPSVRENLDDLEQKLSDFPAGLRQFLARLCKDLWNAIEDGAMEEAIRNESGSIAAQRLAIKNETFIAQAATDYPPEVKQNVSFDHALHLAAIDLSKYDTGSLRRLLDEEDDSWRFSSEYDKEVFMELYPDLRQTIEDSMTIGNPVVRTDRIFKFIHTFVDKVTDEIEDIQNQQTADQERSELQQGEPDDTKNQSGPAQTQNSEGLEQNDPDNVAQQHANITQQTVSRQSDSSNNGDGDNGNDDDSDGDSAKTPGGSDGSDGQMSQSQSDNGRSESSENSRQGQSSDSSQGDDSGTGSTGDSDSTDGSGSSQESGSETVDGSAGESDDSSPICPVCDSTNVDRLVQQVDGMIAARVNAPFDISAEWVDSITFVSNDELCGFRVRSSGTVPVGEIESNGYKVVDVSNGVEVLEPRARYDDTEPVNGFECESCGHAWVPTIGGDLA